VSEAVALTVVAGLGAGVGAGEVDVVRDALASWFGERPAGERWAVLDDAGAVPVLPDGVRAGHFALPAACPCCAGGLVLRAAIARVLRAGPWRRLFLVLPAAAHPAASVDALRVGIAGAAVRVDALVALVDARRASTLLEAPGPAGERARAQAALASLAVVVGGDGAPAAALAAKLADAPAGARPVLVSAAAPPSWQEVRDAIAAPPPPGVRRWPANTVFDRARLSRALEELSRRAPGLALRGVFRTAREWYRWDASEPQAWHPALWRLDSRLQCALTDDEKAEILDSLLADAIEDPLAHGQGGAPPA